MILQRAAIVTTTPEFADTREGKTNPPSFGVQNPYMVPGHSLSICRAAIAYLLVPYC